MIKIMPQILANQIAAGEVVERPASVIKECIENSFDAGASSIEVLVENAGSQFISIKDDGCGIASDELELAICRHATSKISNIEDLHHLNSMGFRGEALASITSVAAVRLYSRQEGTDLGWCLKTLGGVVEEKTPSVMAVGTRIEIENLFFNTPARRRFMRTMRTELSHIEDIFKRLALSKPSVNMKLSHHDKLLRTYPAGDGYLEQDERLKAIMGSEWLVHAIPITASGEGIKMTGWVTKPPYVRSQSDWQYLFVNGRSIKDHSFSHAIKRAMSDLLYQDKHPSWVIYLEIDPENIDVNIHPTKDRIRFAETAWVYDWVYKSMRAIFRPGRIESPAETSSAVDFVRATNFSKSAAKKPQETLPNLWDEFLTSPVRARVADIKEVPNSNHLSEPNLLGADTVLSSIPSFDGAEKMQQKDEGHAAIKAANNKHMQAFCQINGAYILGMCNDEVWIIDIHAAHERQVMEELLKKFRVNGLFKDNLLIPIAIEEGSYDAILGEHQALVGRYGFDVKKENGVWKMYAHPRGLMASYARGILMGLLSCIQKDLVTVDPEMLITEIIADIACHMAVRVSRTMTRIEMQYFMENLNDIPDVCNHGRPWKWVISSADMDRFFMRGR